MIRVKGVFWGRRVVWHGTLGYKGFLNRFTALSAMVISDMQGFTLLSRRRYRCGNIWLLNTVLLMLRMLRLLLGVEIVRVVVGTWVGLQCCTPVPRCSTPVASEKVAITTVAITTTIQKISTVPTATTRTIIRADAMIAPLY